MRLVNHALSGTSPSVLTACDGAGSWCFNSSLSGGQKVFRKKS